MYSPYVCCCFCCYCYFYYWYDAKRVDAAAEEEESREEAIAIPVAEADAPSVDGHRFPSLFFEYQLLFFPREILVVMDNNDAVVADGNDYCCYSSCFSLVLYIQRAM